MAVDDLSERSIISECSITNAEWVSAAVNS